MIKQIKIQGFKGFKNCSINFNKANLLLGANSGGKSSLIQTLLLSEMVLQSNKMGIKSIDVTNNKYKINLYGFDEILSDKAEDDNFTFQLFDTEERNIIISFFPTEDQNVITTLINEFIEDFFPKLIYLSAERSISINQRAGNIDNIYLGLENEYLGYIIEKGKKKLIKPYRDRNYWGNIDNLFLDIQINDWLNYILPNNKVTVKNSGYDNHFSLLFGDKNNLHQTNIGYGVAFILPIIIAGLISDRGSILIVENPELHLHPQAQSKIAIFLSVIANSGVQVFIETHSEHIVNGFRKSVIDTNAGLKSSELIINYFNVNDGCNVEEVPLNEKAEIKYWPEGFMDQEQNDLFEMRKMRLLYERRSSH
ncbi:AAA family ATPase [Anaerovorax odorimutans]|uniref:AAA family ATPase n=1 Tax=Anaerovorax odorimutans TaxID=109327 RepID=UPI00040080AC|nr:AAA family ATPase [Anaerovorax odorimutans]